MLRTQRDHGRGRRIGGRKGFTLMEVLVAFAVISVATWILVSLFTSSLKLEKNARSMRVAADLARSRLADITTRPEAYAWPAVDTITTEAGAPLTLKKPTSENAFATPAVLPTNALAADNETDFYAGFSWDAYVKRPLAGRGFYEIIVVVSWQEAARPKQVVLTSSIPTAMIKETSS